MLRYVTCLLLFLAVAGLPGRTLAEPSSWVEAVEAQTGTIKGNPDREAANEISVDMKRWYRRDWNQCKSPTQLRYANDVVQIVSERSSGLFWQIPTHWGTSMELDLEVYPWLKACKRPPRDFSKKIRQQRVNDFIDVSEYRYITWRWKVDYSTIEEQRVEQNGKLRLKYDDFPAKIGISILKKNSDTIREVAYVWSNTLPESLMFKTETTIIPMIWKLKWRRFVAESGLENAGQWTLESRDLYEDYKKGYPGEEPGKIVRVYLMTDSDNTQSRASASYTDIVFHRQAPKDKTDHGLSRDEGSDEE